jgi:tetratricopeptide (TPR) repeat protein/S1-C subfamily serine protease
LIALTISTFTISAVIPWVVMAQGVTATIDENGVLTLAGAQQAAAKITVRIRVGQGGGSGVLLAKKANTYLVLTNAHVVQEQAAVNITTPDGLVHTAQRVKNAQVGDFDLALLEFNSTRAYDLAKLDNFKMAAGARLREKNTVLAAGFPYNANGLKLLEGAITQLPHEAFRNGTQVGYVTKEDLIQGMSGGPVLDSKGDLVGINSTLARPVIDNYVYADGSKAPVDKVSEYRQANWSVPIYNLLTRLNPDVLYSYEQLPKLQRNNISPTGFVSEINRKAQAITVRIEKNGGGVGSGVIVAKEGNIYYVLTNEHIVINTVLGSDEKFVANLKITTADQRSYKIVSNDVKRFDGTDLSIVKFTSPQSHQVATLGSYSISEGIVFVAGWPSPQNINSQQWQWRMNPGKIASQEKADFKAQDKRSFSNGYDLIYSNLTHGGMSGGPIIDTSGQVIGIHGRAEGINDGIGLEAGNILGNSLGISVKNFLGINEKLGVSSRKLKVIKTPPINLNNAQLASVALILGNTSTPPNSNNSKQWVEYGNQLYRLNKYTDAIRAFDRAITLEPNSVKSHYGKGLALLDSGDNLTAHKAFGQAISLAPQNEKAGFYYLWKYDSISLSRQNKIKEAIEAIAQAVILEPKDIMILNQQAFYLSKVNRHKEALVNLDEILANNKKSWAYNNRGLIKDSLKDYKGALADLNDAIRLSPQDASYYSNRAGTKFNLGDQEGGFFDYSIAIHIDPNYHQAYFLRGSQKLALKDYKGSLSDLNRGLAISPREYLAFFYRGNAKLSLGDQEGAIADYNESIMLNSQYADAYNNRGIIKYKQGNVKGAEADYSRAININPKYAESYVRRGMAKSDLGDKKGAILDYSIAININPQWAVAYTKRGLAKFALGDEKGGSDDIKRAAQLPKDSSYTLFPS